MAKHKLYTEPYTIIKVGELILTFNFNIILLKK